MTNILISPADHELGASLSQAGARIFTWPELIVRGPSEHLLLDEAIDGLFGYDWIILKNEHAADMFWQRLLRLGHTASYLDDVQVLAIGDQAAAKLVDAQVHVDITVARHDHNSVKELLASYLGEQSALSRLNLLVPSAAVTRELFETELMELGARVDSVPAYQTTSNPRRLSELIALLTGGAIDSILFSSPTSVRELAEVCDTDDLTRIAAGAALLCADEATHKEATLFGLNTARIERNLVDAITASTSSR